MAQELQVKPYYDDIINSGSYINTNICSKMGMEFLLSRLLFGGDISRVIYSKEDICFRRRVEMLGNGSVKQDEFNVLGLDLPFAIYSQTGGFEPDDRGSTQSASQIVAGYTHPDTGIIMKGAALKVKYTAVAFFGRRDDLNLASQFTYWEQQPVFPVYYIVQHTLCGYPLDIPVFMTIDSFDMNTEYAEKDWLNKSKIFPLKIEITIRTYQTLIESNGNIKLPIRFAGLYGSNEEEIILTQNTLLAWCDEKLSPRAYPDVYKKQSGIDEINWRVRDDRPYSFPSGIGKPAKDVRLFREHLTEGVTLKDINGTIATIQADAVKGYFEEDREIVLEEFYQVDDGTTEKEIKIQWKYAEECAPNFAAIDLYIPGIYNTEIREFSKDTFVFEGLYPGSTYELTIVTKSSRGTCVTYKLNIKTKGEPALNGKLSDQLVGRVFSYTGIKDH